MREDVLELALGAALSSVLISVAQAGRDRTKSVASKLSQVLRSRSVKAFQYLAGMLAA